ncbi:cytochrome c oxidase subunit 7C, mitochondrial [Thrips palmi]|uniref:Cytochrome c oxidase subunit 7C, mitochondrial n=1 Tax=Thrips palmi TaxID=161013 RepID=A0A6P9AFM4_THRPL|nr:cytochrome c oxidase subunit 7C, mitochondrial [Thrips palmi]
MIASSGARVASAVSRNFSTSVVRAGGHGQEGLWPKAGSNLPFSIENRYKLTLSFMLFTGSAFGLPFYLWLSKP